MKASLMKKYKYFFISEEIFRVTLKMFLPEGTLCTDLLGGKSGGCYKREIARKALES